MATIVFTKPGHDPAVYGPFDYVKVGMAEIYVPNENTEGEHIFAKVYGNFAYPNGIGTSGITVTGADGLGSDKVGWVPEGSSIGYTDFNIFNDEDVD
jgi:hypothetical protein